MTTGKHYIRALTFTALSAAFIAVCSFISIPLTIPITSQTYAVCLTSALLGRRAGVRAVALYILLGLAGIPVFAGFRAGAGVLLGATGGYIAGFMATACIVGSAGERGKNGVRLALSMAAGVAACYALGTAWFILVYARADAPMSILGALSMCVFPYILPDLLKIVAAAMTVRRLRPLMERYTASGAK